MAPGSLTSLLPRVKSGLTPDSCTSLTQYLEKKLLEQATGKRSKTRDTR